MTSTKPYLVRAIYDWILDNGMTPHLLVEAGFPAVQVPQEFVEDGRIVLNIAPGAVRELLIGNDWISFKARFSGTPREVMVPAEAVLGIFARENGRGMVLPDPQYPKDPVETAESAAGETDADTADRGGGASGRKGGGPKLKVVK